MLAHSNLGASSAYRWMACPGSVALAAQAANTSSVYARQGTAAHEIGERGLQLNCDASRFIDEVVEVEGEKFTVDDEMAEAVQVYLDAVRSFITPGDILMIEKRFDLSSVYPGMFGTNDASVVKRKEKTLYVIDYKHGMGHAVDVVDNPQLKYYAIGALLEIKDIPIEKVVLVVVQPRAPHRDGPVRLWETTAYELLEFTGDLQAAAKATEDPDAPLDAGDHCKFCPAAGTCPALAKQALAVASNEFATVTEQITIPPEPHTLTLEELVAILDRADMVQDWLKAVRGHAHALADSGEDVPGWKLVPKRATRKWAEEEETLAPKLEAEFGIAREDMYALKIKSPAQLEKGLKADQKKKLSALVTKESSGANLVRDTASDSRPALPSKAARDFATVASDQPAALLF